MSEAEVDKEMSPGTESSHGDGSDVMFPASNDTLAIPNQQTAAGELSPPYSQDPPEANDDDAMDLTGGEPQWEASNQNLNPAPNENGHTAKNEFARNAENKYQPGAWDTPKLREESQRVWNSLLDKNFSLKRFGDIFDDNEDNQR